MCVTEAMQLQSESRDAVQTLLMPFHFRLLAFSANAIVALVLVSIGNIGCSHGFSRNDGTELLISLKRICSKTWVQVGEFHRGRYLIRTSFVPACSWKLIGLVRHTDLWSCGRGEKIKRMVSMCSLFIINMSAKWAHPLLLPMFFFLSGASGTG